MLLQRTRAAPPGMGGSLPAVRGPGGADRGEAGGERGRLYNCAGLEIPRPDEGHSCANPVPQTGSNVRKLP